MSWLNYANYVGQVHGNNDNTYQDDTDASLFYIHNADNTVFTYRLEFLPRGGYGAVKRDMALAHEAKITGAWPHYYLTRKEI